MKFYFFLNLLECTDNEKADEAVSNKSMNLTMDPNKSNKYTE